MDALWVYLLTATFGLPIFGVILLMVAALISLSIYLSRRSGKTIDADYPKVLFFIALGLIVIPSVWFFSELAFLTINGEVQ